MRQQSRRHGRNPCTAVSTDQQGLVVGQVVDHHVGNGLRVEAGSRGCWDRHSPWSAPSQGPPPAHHHIGRCARQCTVLPIMKLPHSMHGCPPEPAPRRVGRRDRVVHRDAGCPSGHHDFRCGVSSNTSKREAGGIGLLQSSNGFIRGRSPRTTAIRSTVARSLPGQWLTGRDNGVSWQWHHWDSGVHVSGVGSPRVSTIQAKM